MEIKTKIITKININIIKILTILMVIILFISIAGLNNFLNIPKYTISKDETLLYQQNIYFSYIASVKPSIIYAYKNKIDETYPLYENLINSINISIKYNLFHTLYPINIENKKITYSLHCALEGIDWSIDHITKNNMTIENNFIDTITVNMTEVQNMIDIITTDINSNVLLYYYVVEPTINFQGEANGTKITESFSKKLTFTIQLGKIKADQLMHSKTQKLYRDKKSINFWYLFGWKIPVSTMQNYATYSTILSLVLTSLGLYIYSEKNKTIGYLDRLSSDLRKKIIHTSNIPIKNNSTIIKLKNINALVILSEDLFKPILYHEYKFYVIDNETTYLFEYNEYKK